MKILLITDQHFGVRNDNQSFIDHYRKFYKEVVLPFIDAHKIDTIICLGDTFDKRRSINFMSLEAAKEMWFDPLHERNIRMHMLVGNHDIYYKNTLRVNAPSELLGKYENITVYTEPTTVTFDGVPILLLPWICDDNRDESLRTVTESNAPICMGHLEFNGFEAHPGHVMQNGMDSKHFAKFGKVFSGHYHMKSSKKNVTYLGNPYQLYWNDYGCKRGFHVLNTETFRTTFYRNPFDIFHKLYYNGGVVLPDPSELKGAYVKLIVEDKGDYAKFDYAVSQLQDMGLGDLKIIEDLSIETGNSEVLESEDTMTLLDNYIDEIDLKVNKSNIKTVMRSLYMEAAEI
ncbi:recombination-related endonuclease [Synechococcus phage S-CAM22]|uniref:Recombination-related endonuclease n=1 Tax=Synechococcus phage S-CAM22 TaxID=1883365 RepID=A0A1D8KRQ7_9CAUD|nr:SbcD-like subunit of palindrome specific endonuclease [Synechococcus phage S-CAM22]YP_010088781.1 SbcD-like subunit of palindrome specific endonuclease [Synechococcus phage S-CAM22]AOV60952.1 recombination-related endonuclease [Synechococcus phage S-CAM22]AOV61166.1 recombination-related endonuclease [Synechococcus phage S-CAM22]AOV61380.1 recombination-related endonuclease [Synechococcus phage S-CAM22]